MCIQLTLLSKISPDKEPSENFAKALTKCYNFSLTLLYGSYFLDNYGVTLKQVLGANSNNKGQFSKANN